MRRFGIALVVLVVVVALGFAAVLYLNTGHGEPIHRTAADLTAEVMAANGCNDACMRDHNRIAGRVSISGQLGPAARQTLDRRCVDAWRTGWAYINNQHQILFRVWQSVSGCGLGPKPGVWADGDPDFNRGWNVPADAPWWDAWRLTRWEDPVTGAGINDNGWRYRYRRQPAYFQACWVGACLMDETPWVADTIRTNGTMAEDISP